MKTKKPFSLPAVLIFLFFGLNACAPTSQISSDGKMKILATTSFLADIAQNVAGDRLQVEALLPAGIDPHEYQPTPRDAIKIEEATILIVNGLGYETWMQKLLDSAQNKPLMIVATEGLTPNPDGDPHTWMNPLNVARYVETIRAGFGQIDPANKTVFAANATAYIAKLNDLDQWIKNEVAQIPVEKRLLVTNHEALGYFAEAYGFTIIGTVLPGLSSEAAPTGTQLADLIETIKRTDARAVFLDVSENQKLADQIAEETQVKIVTGLYIETLSKLDGPAPTYIDMLRYDVGLIASALK